VHKLSCLMTDGVCAVLQAVPFLYELRALLDWTCSATPLNWYQWLKLEDIRASLFVEECRWEWQAPALTVSEPASGAMSALLLHLTDMLQVLTVALVCLDTRFCGLDPSSLCAGELTAHSVPLASGCHGT
jgi:hypothetical protein